MRKISCLIITIFIMVGCQKEDLQNLTSESLSAKKGIPVLSEVWVNNALQQKNYYENGRLVRIVWPSPPGSYLREYQYDYRSQDHYVVMTGDYMYWHYYFNSDHQLVRAEVGDEDGSADRVWVRHEFTWDKDRIATHTWVGGDLQHGNYGGSLDSFDYKNPWEAKVKEYNVYYSNGIKVEETLRNVYHYRWQSPFEFRTTTGPNSYTANVYSNLIKMPSYNIVGFPWGQYSIEQMNKHDLRNMLASNWNRAYNSGMLLMELKEVNNGQEKIITQKRNLVTNKDKLPDSYDEFYGFNNTSVHYEFKYIRL